LEISDLNGDFDELFTSSTNQQQTNENTTFKLPKLDSLKEVAIQLQTHETKEIPFRLLNASDLHSAFTLEVSHVCPLFLFYFILLYFIVLFICFSVILFYIYLFRNQIRKGKRKKKENSNSKINFNLKPQNNKS
jgi:hypothetical protein